MTTNWVHFAKVAGVLGGTGIVNLGLSIIYRRLLPRLKKSKLIWDDALACALIKPLRWAIWFNGLFFAGVLATHFVEIASSLARLEPYRRTGTVLFLAWFSIRFIRELEIRYIARDGDPKDRLDKTTLRAISQILRIGVIAIGGLVVLPILGIPLSGVIAFGGVGGMAIGFAAKDLLANFFGGLMIFLDRPFAIGDWIRSPDRNIEGHVEHIGWRLTRIRTFEKRPLFIPNNLFLNLSIENPSRMLCRRIKDTIGVRYQDASKIGKIVEEIEAMLNSHPGIDHSQSTNANFINFGPSSLDIQIYTFTKATDRIPYEQVKQDVFLKTIAIIEANGAACAFPTTTLDFSDDGLAGALESTQMRLFSKKSDTSKR